MSSSLQTLFALLVVAGATVWLVLRSLAAARKPGCGGGCGCDSAGLRAGALKQAKGAPKEG
jgi:hypothetical protein